MKVLFLNQAFYPDVVATAQQASDLAAHLVERGHSVTVVCNRRAYDDPTDRYQGNEVWRGVRIRRISSFWFGKQAPWRRAADFASFMANCTIHLARLPRFDVVIALTSPPLISCLGAVFTAIKGGRFVFWVMDLNPDEALAAGWLRPNSWTTKRLMALLNYGLHRATTIVVLDRFMVSRIVEKGIAREKILTVPPWSRDDVVRYDIEGRRRFRQEHGLNAKYVVMYSGNHSPCHPLFTLLEAAARLTCRHDIAFCFVGGGSEFQTVRRFAEIHELSNIVTVPYQSIERTSASLSSADLHVVVMGDPFVGIVHPCKVYNILSLRTPFLYIGPAVSHVADLTPTFSAEHGDVDTVVRHIKVGADRAHLRTPLRSDLEGSRKYLLNKMALALEAAALGSTLTARSPVVRTVSQ